MGSPEIDSRKTSFFSRKNHVLWERAWQVKNKRNFDVIGTGGATAGFEVFAYPTISMFYILNSVLYNEKNQENKT